MVSSLIDVDTRRWKVDKLKRYFLPFEVDVILNISLSYTLLEDKIIWVGNKRGIFLVKNAYYIAMTVVEEVEVGESSSRDYRTPLWKKIWQLKLLAKIQIFAWRACMEGLPTRLNLRRRGVNIETKCPLCEREIESTSHALLYCTKLWDVWWSWNTCPIQLLAENKDFVDVAMLIMNAGTPQDLEILFATAWSIWYNRNRVVHESQCETPAQVWGYGQRIHGDYKGAMTVCQLRKQPPEVGWAAPPPKVYKINVDGATSEGGLSGVGVVICDCRCSVLVAKSKVLAGSYEAEITETLAIEEGVLLARERGLH